MSGKVKRALWAFGMAVMMASAGAVTPVGASSGAAPAAKAVERPMYATTSCYYSWMATYYWVTLLGGNVACPRTHTFYIGGSFKTGTLWKRTVRL